jgi:hypothetical protein
MKKIVKLSLVLLSLGLATGCTGDEEIAPYKQQFFSQTFEDQTAGSGSAEIPINIEGWTNFNSLGTRKWICKTYNDTKYAEFSSYYSASGTSDQTWLITSKIDFTKTEKETLNFDLQARYSNGAEFKVLVSTDFDETTAGIATATWAEITVPTLPTVDNVFVNSGLIDISSNNYNTDNVHIAFKYIGTKAGNKTTTFQLDNIKLFENK